MAIGTKELSGKTHNIKVKIIMAKPIKETPVLKGKDADNFTRNMKESFNTKVSQEEYLRIKENYEKIYKLLPNDNGLIRL